MGIQAVGGRFFAGRPVEVFMAAAIVPVVALECPRAVEAAARNHRAARSAALRTAPAENNGHRPDTVMPVARRNRNLAIVALDRWDRGVVETSPAHPSERLERQHAGEPDIIRAASLALAGLRYFFGLGQSFLLSVRFYTIRILARF